MIKNINRKLGSTKDTYNDVTEMTDILVRCGRKIPEDGLIEGRDYVHAPEEAMKLALHSALYDVKTFSRPSAAEIACKVYAALAWGERIVGSKDTRDENYDRTIEIKIVFKNGRPTIVDMNKEVSE